MENWKIIICLVSNYRYCYLHNIINNIRFKTVLLYRLKFVLGYALGVSRKVAKR
jgi:hypothetical protein